MAHSDRVFPLIGLSTVPTYDQLRQLDQLGSQVIDGDNGGSWNPLTPIVIGGAGVAVNAYGSFQGPVSTGPRARAGGGLILGNSDYPAIVGGRSRTFVVPLQDYAQNSTRDFITNYDETIPASIQALTAAGVKSVFSFIVPSYRFPSAPGAYISNMAVNFRVGLRPVAVPSIMPGFVLQFAQGVSSSIGQVYLYPNWTALTAHSVGDAVYPVPAFGNARQFRCITAGTTGAAQPAAFTSAATNATVNDGTVVWRTEVGSGSSATQLFTLPRPESSNVDAYFLTGTLQQIAIPTMPYLPAFNGVDTETFASGRTYVMTIQDQSGTLNKFHSLSITVTAIASLFPGT